jgi:hypothetical protein
MLQWCAGYPKDVIGLPNSQPTRSNAGDHPAPGRSLRGALELDGGVEEAEVAEGLREVAEHLVRGRVVLFAEETEVVAGGEALLEHRAGAVELADGDEVVGEPEFAQQERALVAGETVVRAEGLSGTGGACP